MSTISTAFSILREKLALRYILKPDSEDQERASMLDSHRISNLSSLLQWKVGPARSMTSRQSLML
jgi:hypothetical protein